MFCRWNYYRFVVHRTYLVTHGCHLHDVALGWVGSLLRFIQGRFVVFHEADERVVWLVLIERVVTAKHATASCASPPIWWGRRLWNSHDIAAIWLHVREAKLLTTIATILWLPRRIECLNPLKPATLRINRSIFKWCKSTLPSPNNIRALT